MKVSELIEQLKNVLATEGDLELAKEGNSDDNWYSDNVSDFIEVHELKRETRCWRGNLNPNYHPGDFVEKFVVIN